MNRSEVADVMSTVARFFPATKWEPETTTEVGRRISKMPIDVAQAVAALTNLKCGHKYARVDEREVLAALEGAVPAAKLPAATNAATRAENKRAVETLRDTRPEVFWNLAQAAVEAGVALPQWYNSQQGFWEHPPTAAWIAARIPPE